MKKTNNLKSHISNDGIGITVFSVVILLLFALITFIPFWNVVCKAFSADWAVISGKVTLFPIGFQLKTIKTVLTGAKCFASPFTSSPASATPLAIFAAICSARSLSISRTLSKPSICISINSHPLPLFLHCTVHQANDSVPFPPPLLVPPLLHPLQNQAVRAEFPPLLFR